MLNNRPAKRTSDRERRGAGPGKDRAQTKFCMIPRGPESAGVGRACSPGPDPLRAASLSCGSRLDSP